eukprot:356500-Chlamydomonas_euryale.AAC.13
MDTACAVRTDGECLRRYLTVVRPARQGLECLQLSWRSNHECGPNPCELVSHALKQMHICSDPRGVTPHSDPTQ